MRISRSDLRDAMGPERFAAIEGKLDQKPAGKYGARKVEVDGFKFDSALEAKRYEELAMMVRTGHLTDVLVHTPTIRFRGTNVTYTLDFLVIDRDGKTWAEDVKGALLQGWKVKWKMARAQHPKLDLRYLTKAKNGWEIHRNI